MLLELHAHSAEHSACSHVPAVELIRRIQAKGLQGLVLTDHHYQWSEEELCRLLDKAKVPAPFLLLSGQEVKTRELGDVLVFGADRSLPAGTSLAELRRRFPEAALIWAHPYRRGKRPAAEKLTHPLLDGVEIFNSNQSVLENSRGLRDWHRHRFTAIAGTDTHGASYAGLYPTLLDHPVASLDELAAELRAGRCRPFLKEIPKAGSKSVVTEVTIGAKGQDEVRERLVIRTLDRAGHWDAADREHRLRHRLLECGFDLGPYRVARPIDEEPEALTLIDQGLRGKSLYEKLLAAPEAEGRRCLQMAARWLARLHGCGLRLNPPEDFLEQESRKLERYLRRFTDMGHPHLRRIEELVETVARRERELAARGAGSWVQGHGDFHPKNLIVGQDHLEDPGSLFVGAIDFESSLCQPPAYDVGTFLAQFRHQFFHDPGILERYPEELFLAAYLGEGVGVEEDFRRQVEIYRARANLSIAAYLVKLGQGLGEDLWRVMLESEQALSLSGGEASG